MGDILSGVFGSGQRTTAETKPDAISQQLNNLRLRQLTQLFGTSAYGDYALPRSDIYTPTQASTDLIKQATEPTQFDFSNLLNLDDYIKLGLDQSQNYITQIARPEILSQLSLAGLESSGAAPEAIAKATAQIGLPFVQGLPQASIGLTSAQNLLPAQLGLTNAQRATTLFPLTDFGRSLQEQDLLRQQGVVTTGLTGLPFTPGQSTAQRQSSQPLFNFFGQG